MSVSVNVAAVLMPATPNPVNKRQRYKCSKELASPTPEVDVSHEQHEQRQAHRRRLPMRMNKIKVSAASLSSRNLSSSRENRKRPFASIPEASSQQARSKSYSPGVDREGKSAPSSFCPGRPNWPVMRRFRLPPKRTRFKRHQISSSAPGVVHGGSQPLCS